MRKWPVVLGVFLVTGALVIFGLSTRLGPSLRERVIEEIQQRYQSEVELSKFDLSLFPQILATGEGLTLRYHGDANAPPMVSVRKFSIETGLSDVLSGPKRVRKLRLEGLRITVGHGVARPHWSPQMRKQVPSFIIDEVIADGAVLEVLSKKPGHVSLTWEMDKLALHSAGPNQPMKFRTTLKNAKPPGMIDATGEFGPWRSGDPIQTPLSGSYVFRNADLSVFRGIAGTLSSEGKFGGVLGHIETQGITDTPDFSLHISGHPVHLKTQFHAIVDAGDGDTRLQPVDAHLARSSLLARGGVTGTPGVKGKTVALDLTIPSGRLEDLLRLALKSDKPFMTGLVTLRTKFNLPPGDVDVIDKLALNGQFRVANGKFKNASLQGKVNALSQRARGQVGRNETDEEVVSNLQGDFALKNSVMTFSKLSFGVPGALVQLAGTYGLSDEKLDFHGKIRLQAKLSQMTTGIKSVLLKAADPFFAKHGAGSEFPIRITGTRQDPSFGLEFRRKGK